MTRRKSLAYLEASRARYDRRMNKMRHHKLILEPKPHTRTFTITNGRAHWEHFTGPNATTLLVPEGFWAEEITPEGGG